MSHRYAVLWELCAGKATPVGLAVEQGTHVLVEVREDLAMPTRYEAPFLVQGPDMTVVQYGPKEKQYFDQVLLDLSRTFVIGAEGSVNEATGPVVLGLLREHVLEPRRRETRVIYCDPNSSWPVVQEYRRTHYAADGDEQPAVAAPSKALRSSLVAA